MKTLAFIGLCCKIIPSFKDQTRRSRFWTAFFRSINFGRSSIILRSIKTWSNIMKRRNIYRFIYHKEGTNYIETLWCRARGYSLERLALGTWKLANIEYSPQCRFCAFSKWCQSKKETPPNHMVNSDRKEEVIFLRKLENESDIFGKDVCLYRVLDKQC